MIRAGRWHPGWVLPLLLGAMVVLGGIMGVLSPEQRNPDPFANRSIYSTGPTGYRAWYLAGRKAGLTMKTWERPFAELAKMPGPATMLLVEPYTVSGTSVLFGQTEVEHLLAWAAKGNTIILLDDFKRQGSRYLLNSLELQIRNPEPAGKKNPVSLFLPEKARLLGTYVTKPLLTQVQSGFEPESKLGFPAGTVLQNAHGRPLLLGFRYSRGRILLGTTVDLAANAYLNQPSNDNYQFLANLLRVEGKPVYVNEFVHGYNEIGDLLSWYQQKTPLGKIIMQLCFGFLFALWLSLFPWKPRQEQPAQESTNEDDLVPFIDSLAGLSYRARAAGLALAPLLDELDSILRRRYRFSLEDESRLQHLIRERFGAYSNSIDESPEALLEAIRETRILVRTQEPTSHRNLLRRTRQLDAVLRRLQAPGSAEDDKQERAPWDNRKI